MAENLPGTNVGNIEYIRRQDAVSRISDLLVLELKMTRCPTWNEVYNTIGDLPSADVAPVVHGEWIKEWWHGETARKCSVCHITQTVNVYEGKVKFNYCPYCGAKMDKE